MKEVQDCLSFATKYRKVQKKKRRKTRPIWEPLKMKESSAESGEVGAQLDHIRESMYLVLRRHVVFLTLVHTSPMANEWLRLASAAWLTPSPPATTAGFNHLHGSINPRFCCWSWGWDFPLKRCFSCWVRCHPFSTEVQWMCQFFVFFDVLICSCDN